MGFYLEASSHTEASNEALRKAARRFPWKRIEIRDVEKLRSSIPSEDHLNNMIIIYVFEVRNIDAGPFRLVFKSNQCFL